VQFRIFWIRKGSQALRTVFSLLLSDFRKFSQYPKHTADATELSSWVASASASAGRTEFETSSRRLLTDSVDNLETEHSGLTTWILIYIDNFFNNDVTELSLVTNLNSSTAQEIVNWCAFAPPRRHDETQLRCWQICPDSSRLSPTSCEFNTHLRRNSTRQLSRVGVGGVYCA